MTDNVIINEVKNKNLLLVEEEKECILSLATADGNKDKGVSKVINFVFYRLENKELYLEKNAGYTNKEALLECLKNTEKSYKQEHEKARKLGVTTRYFQQSSCGKLLSTIYGFLDCDFYIEWGLSGDGFSKFLKASKLTACTMKAKVYEYYNNSIQAVEEEESESTSEESTGEEESKTSKSEVEKTLEKFLSYLKSFKKLDSVEKVKFSLLVKEEVKKINEKENLENRGISKKEG